MKNCCGLSLTDGNCPKPGVMLHRLPDGTTSIVLAHPCARVLMFLPQVSMSEAGEVTLSVQEAPLYRACTPWTDPSRALLTPRNGLSIDVGQIHDQRAESDTMP